MGMCSWQRLCEESDVLPTIGRPMCPGVDFSGLHALSTNCTDEEQLLFQEQRGWWSLYLLRQMKGCIWEVELDVADLSTELHVVLTMG